MEVFKWKETDKTVFVRIRNIEEGDKKIYSLFNEECKTYLTVKLKFSEGYDKAHNSQDSIKLLDIIRSAVFGMEALLQGPWSMMKANKSLYTLLQRSNTKNNEYMKGSNKYAKVVRSHIIRKLIHPGLTKQISLICKCITQITRHHKKRRSQRGGVKEYYLACIMLYGPDKGKSGNIKTNHKKYTLWIRHLTKKQRRNF